LQDTWGGAYWLPPTAEQKYRLPWHSAVHVAVPNPGSIDAMRMSSVGQPI
jgi:hypothetical protein